ncbi:MAG TPA: sensor histidine kinase [Spirochaetia bacterium]|nr:sensor histidine kinase [Spirochaetia bacterium]
MRRRPSLRFSGLQATIALTLFSLVFVAVLVIELVSYNLTEGTVARNSEAYTYQLIGEAEQNIDSYITYMKNISSVIMFNHDVESYFTDPNAPQGRKISDLLDSIKRTRKDVNLIALFGTDGKVLSDRTKLDLNPYVNPATLSWYRAALRAKGNPVVSPSHVQNVVDNQYRWVISLSRLITDSRTGKPLAVLVVDLNFSVIRDICMNLDLGNRGYVFIVSNDGTIIYHPQQQLIYSNLKQEKIKAVLNAPKRSFTTGTGRDRRIYTIRSSDQTGWRIVGVTYVNALVSDKQFLQIYYTLLGVACFTVVLFLSVLISFRISKPIKMLTSSMREVESGNFDIQVQIAATDEIGNLARTFNIMIAKIKELMLQNVKEHDAKRRAELQALQAQINPHFLYNTLDSVVWMAEEQQHDGVVRMVSSLSKLLRHTISKGEEMITVLEEIEHIHNYLIIQKMRYRDKLDYIIEVDRSIYSHRVMKILLQPLVENSIYHGIKNKKGRGTVKVVGKKIGGNILLQVIDDGVGFDAQEMERIINTSEEEAGEGDLDSTGVGVRNVNDRIKLYYGDGYGLNFRCNYGSGTIVDVWLPAR